MIRFLKLHLSLFCPPSRTIKIFLHRLPCGVCRKRKGEICNPLAVTLFVGGEVAIPFIAPFFVGKSFAKKT